MEKRVTSGTMVALILVGMLALAFNIQPAKAEPTTWTVDDDGLADFHTIQEAIDTASPGDTIFVCNGTYYEHLSVEKNNLTIIGQNPVGTIVDAGGFGVVFTISGEWNTVSRFKIQNGDSGVGLCEGSQGNEVSENVITSNYWDGICVGKSGEHIIRQNIVTLNTWHGIRLLAWSKDNSIIENFVSENNVGIFVELTNNTIISGNTVTLNNFGILIREDSYDNRVSHNNLIDNSHQGVDEGGYSQNDIWDNGYPSGGNYWGDYSINYPTVGDEYQGENQDVPGSDGIWDHPYEIDDDNQDNYPLVNPWTPGPDEETQELIETIETWSLPRGTENSLTSKLEDALHLLDIGNENGATQKLMDFINQVEALREKKLDDAQANYLIAEAQRIIDLINE